jgi:hypothetical protein
VSPLPAPDNAFRCGRALWSVGWGRQERVGDLWRSAEVVLRPGRGSVASPALDRIILLRGALPLAGCAAYLSSPAGHSRSGREAFTPSHPPNAD